VAKPELGTKRTCPNCGTRYYDLNHDPIVCPNCGTVFEVVALRSRPAAAKPPPAVEVEEEVEAVEEKAVLVPLEEADAEAAETGAVAVETDDEDEEIEADDTFLEEDDEEDEDVADIIGDVDDEEER
jgi:uncharacterized protein (TIGR02300 family)